MDKKLQGFLENIKGFAVKELKEFLFEARQDSNKEINKMGDLVQELLLQRASNKIDNDELKKLMQDVLNLQKMQALKLEVKSKARVERIKRGIEKIVIDGLLRLI